MTTKEQLVQTIETLNDTDLQKVAEYVALLKLRAKFVPKADLLSQIDEITLLSEPVLAEDWNHPEEDAAWSHLQPNQPSNPITEPEFADEDRQLAEEGLGDYLDGLIAEDECE